MTATLAPSLFGKMMNDAEQFAIAFEQPIAEYPNFPTGKLQKHRFDMLFEEFNEYLDAEQDDDLVEVADALADIVYIALGTALAYGLVLTGGREYLAWGYISQPKLSGALGIRLACVKAMGHAWDRYQRAEMDGSDLQHIAATLQNLVNMCLDIAFTYSIPFEKIWDEVHGSNMRKLVDGKIVRHPETGKVLKPEGWQPPNLKQILIDAGAGL